MKNIKITLLEVVKVLSFIGVLIVLIIQKFELNIFNSIFSVYLLILVYDFYKFLCKKNKKSGLIKMMKIKITIYQVVSIIAFFGCGFLLIQENFKINVVNTLVLFLMLSILYDFYKILCKK